MWFVSSSYDAFLLSKILLKKLPSQKVIASNTYGLLIIFVLLIIILLMDDNRLPKMAKTGRFEATRMPGRPPER